MKFKELYYFENEFLDKFAADNNLSNIRCVCLDTLAGDKLCYQIIVNNNLYFKAFKIKEHDGQIKFIIKKKYKKIYKKRKTLFDIEEIC